MKTDEYGIQSCLAACHDLVARNNGCSDHERRLRSSLPVGLYYNDPTFREVMIKLEVIKQRNSRGW